jgi:transcriptional regulator with XRE-family HTH domain
MPATPKRAGRTPKAGSRFPSQVVADNLRMIRSLRGLSQMEVAGQMRRLGHDWTQTTVSQVELGARHVNIDELCALALTLSVYIDELLSPVTSPRLKADIRGKTDPPPPPDTNVDVGTAEPLPGRFVADWLRGQSGDTQLVETSNGELYVGRVVVIQDEGRADDSSFSVQKSTEQPSSSEEPQS